MVHVEGLPTEDLSAVKPALFVTVIHGLGQQGLVQWAMAPHCIHVLCQALAGCATSWAENQHK